MAVGIFLDSQLSNSRKDYIVYSAKNTKYSANFGYGFETY